LFQNFIEISIEIIHLNLSITKPNNIECSCSNLKMIKWLKQKFYFTISYINTDSQYTIWTDTDTDIIFVKYLAK